MKLKDLDSNTVHRMVNTSFNDAIVSLIVKLDTLNLCMTCVHVVIVLVQNLRHWARSSRATII